MKHLLILGGSGETRDILQALEGASDWRVTTSLLHPPRLAPLPDVGEVRIGGFGGAKGFLRYLEGAGVSAVLDATHPFAARISQRSAALCRARDIPYLQLLRPAWTPGVNECWTEVADEAEAARRVPEGARVFTTTGRAMLDGFRYLRGGHLYVRQLTRREVPEGMQNVTFVFGEGPFSVEDEMATFRALQIDMLVAKNSGGTVSRTKLEAAGRLGLGVILIERPEPACGSCVAEVSAALEWVAGL